jgi:mono/diheme cytochrome c family protein
MKSLAAAAALLAASVASADGKSTFTSKCVACHGADGKGQSAMAKKLGVKDLTSSKLTVKEMEAVVTTGKGKMTAFGAKLTPAEVSEVVAYVKGGLK